MNELAKQGFTQSYTYFTWRNSKAELIEYVNETDENRSKGILSPEFLAEYARYQSVPTAKQ
jgi:starch synthase (maltosyl-transferring)